MSSWKVLPLSIVLVSLTACSANTNTQVQSESVTDNKSTLSSTINGTVTYRERILLPKNAKLIVRLENTAKQDVAATLVKEQEIDLSTPPPWAFQLDYDPSNIEDSGVYTLRARVEVDGKLRFINTSSVNAFSQEPINIIVSSTNQKNLAIESQQYNQAILESHIWRLAELNGQTVDTQVSGKEVGLTFDQQKQRVSGYSGCNEFSGEYKASGPRLTVSSLSSTAMLCMKESIEGEYLKALPLVHFYKLEEGRLTALDINNNELLKFEISELNKIESLN